MTSNKIDIPDHRPVVFLDVDDVFCLDGMVSGFAILHLWRYGRQSMLVNSPLWGQVFCPQACRNLAALDGEFEPTYVVSSSWADHFGRVGMWEVFQRTGLGFVVERMHEDWTSQVAWPSGLKGPALTHRGQQIQGWIQQHPPYAAYLVIDDPESGKGILQTNLGAGSTVVMCPLGVGFQAEQYEMARDGLLRALGRPPRTPASTQRPAVAVCAPEDPVEPGAYDPEFDGQLEREP